MTINSFTFNHDSLPQVANTIYSCAQQLDTTADVVVSIRNQIDSRGWELRSQTAYERLGRALQEIQQVADRLHRTKSNLDSRISDLFTLTNFTAIASSLTTEGVSDDELRSEDAGSPRNIGKLKNEKSKNKKSKGEKSKIKVEAKVTFVERKAHRTFGPNKHWDHQFGSKDNGLQVEAHALRGDLDAHGALIYGKDGLGVEGGASASYDVVGVSAQGRVTRHYGPATITGEVGAAGKVDARAGGTGNLSIDGKGAHAGLDLQAYVGGELQGAGSLGAKVAGVDTKLQAHASVLAGAGAWFKADGTVSLTHIKAELDMGAALGIGAGTKVDVDVDATEAVHTVTSSVSDTAKSVGGFITHLDSI